MDFMLMSRQKKCVVVFFFFSTNKFLLSIHYAPFWAIRIQYTKQTKIPAFTENLDGRVGWLAQLY